MRQLWPISHLIIKYIKDMEELNWKTTSIHLLKGIKMKIASSLKSLKKRDLNSKLVKRRGRVYIINKKNPKFKARQK